MIALRLHRQGIQMLVAACDEELLGELFTEGDLRLEVAPSFYDEVRVSAEELQRALSQATMANLVGKSTVDAALQAGFITKDGVSTIGGTPHAQMVSI